MVSDYLYCMLCIQSRSFDPFFNLAAEEYLLRNSREEIFMLWQSNPVVVVGKHQNALAEINYRYVRANDIPVARRLTGGGTVFHDAGNVNFTFIRKGEPGKMVDFASFIAPVISFLQKLGIEAIRGLKNEILVNGKKISGNAEHVYKDMVLHHGTLLFNSDLDKLAQSIRAGSGRFIDRAVQSNRSSVANLSDCMHSPMGTGEFIDRFMQDILTSYNGKLHTLGRSEAAAIEKIAFEKYRTWEWIYGWSPDYTYMHEHCKGEVCMNIELNTHRGMIVSCLLDFPALPGEMCTDLMAKLPGTSHEEGNIRKLSAECGFNRLLSNKDFEDFIVSFFG